MAIYGPPSYQMGDDAMEINATATQPITAAQAQRARLELARMKRSLTGWLKYRAINDSVAAGVAVPGALLKRPGARASAPTPGFMIARQQDEQRLATNLYRLLSEIFDPSTLPTPSSPNAAVELALIAIGGKLPGEQQQPQGVGFIWLWPAVIVAGIIAFVVAQKIRSDAETAQERERLECIKSGKCTDYGFWLKAGGAVAVGWFIWDKLGVRERVQHMKGRAAAGRR